MNRKTLKNLTVAVVAGAMIGLGDVAGAVPVTFTALLSGANENPMNISPGTGTATVVFDTDADTMQVIVSFTGLTGTTTNAHIHCCVTPPGNASVATVTPTFVGFPAGVTSGNYDQTYDTSQLATYNPSFVTASGGTAAAAEAALFAGLAAGTAYLNIHTVLFPGGEIRGFLTSASVPEPSSLLLLGFGMLGLTARRGVRRAA